MWSLGDYADLARLLEPSAERLADFAGIRSGMDVLDVAAGNGNFAMACAARGAHVVACDLTPAMVQMGRERSTAGGFEIEWREADAEALPFGESEFDVVGSVFGAIFAPRPGLVATELFRVARRGGAVAMANYSDGGFLGRFAGLLARFSASPPVKLPSPFEWGDEAELRRRFDGLASSIQVEPATITFKFASVDEGLAFWERTNPPHIALRSMLQPDDDARFMGEVRSLMEELNVDRTGGLALESPYVAVLACK